MTVSQVRELEGRLGYRFRNADLLAEALTHSTYANENKGQAQSNERLEFLGDAVLQLAVSRFLFDRYPNAPEGELSRYRQNLVCGETLAALAAHLQLGSYLRLGRGEEKKGARARASFLANAMEALAAAVFLDAGEEGYTRAACVLAGLFDRLPDIGRRIEGMDCKTRLKQLVEQAGEELLSYEVTEKSGPVHAPTYSVEAHLNSNVIGRGRGKSRQEAEEEAARAALLLFGIAST